MATYNVAAGGTGVTQKSFGTYLDATDVIVFPTTPYAIRVRNDGTYPGVGNGYLYITVNGTAPAPGTPGTYELLAAQFADIVITPVPSAGPLTVMVRHPNPSFQPGGYDMSLTNRYGYQCYYSVDARLTAADQWPSPPVPQRY